MREIILIVILVATLAHTTYTQRKTIPDYKARIAELEGTVETLKKEAPKQKVATKSEKPAVDSPVKADAPAVVAPVEDHGSDELTKAKAAQEEARRIALSETAARRAEAEQKAAARDAIDERLKKARAVYQQQVSELDAQINRGSAIRNATASEQPNFKEYIVDPITQKKSGVRTSNADRQRWQQEKDERLARMDAALADLDARRQELDRLWEQTEEAANAERAALK